MSSALVGPSPDLNRALHARTRGEIHNVPGWSITKRTPKTPVWARSRHGAARVTHRVRYQLEAVEKKWAWGREPIRYAFTIWVCGGKATDWRGIDIMPDPIAGRRPLKERCHGCENPRKP